MVSLLVGAKQARGEPGRDHDQRQRQQHQQRRHGVDLGRHRDLDHRVDLQRQRRRSGAGGEEGDDEIVDRQRERHQRAGDHARHDQRQRHAAERLPRRGAAVARRLGQALVHAGQARAHDDGDEADAERDVREDDRHHAQREVEQHEEDQQRDAHQDLRNRDRRQHQDRQQPHLVAVHRDAGHGAEHRGHEARGERRSAANSAPPCSISSLCEELAVPVEREADPLGVEPRIVERIDDDDRPAARRGTHTPASAAAHSAARAPTHARLLPDGLPCAPTQAAQARRAPAPRPSARSTARCRTASRACRGTAA